MLKEPKPKPGRGVSSVILNEVKDLDTPEAQ